MKAPRPEKVSPWMAGVRDWRVRASILKGIVTVEVRFVLRTCKPIPHAFQASIWPAAWLPSKHYDRMMFLRALLDVDAIEDCAAHCEAVRIADEGVRAVTFIIG